MQSVLVSIIIPVYNVERYIEECLNSVLSQTYENIEIIVVNDGSTDRSRDIIKKFADKDTRIIFVDNENKGVGASRNDGLKSAKGEYIFFVDSDDHIDSSLLETLLDSISDNDICIFNGTSFSDLSGEIISREYFAGLNSEKLKDAIASNTYREFLFYYIACYLKLYKTEFLRKKQIYFPEGLYGEDVIFWLKCYLNTKAIVYTNFAGYYRRYREGSIMTSNSIKNIKDRIDSLPELFLLSEGYDSLQIKIIGYTLENWFDAYRLNDRLLLDHTLSVISSLSISNRIEKINLSLELKIRYYLCRYTNAFVIKMYKFLFYTVYKRTKSKGELLIKI